MRAIEVSAYLRQLSCVLEDGHLDRVSRENVRREGEPQRTRCPASRIEMAAARPPRPAPTTKTLSGEFDISMKGEEGEDDARKG
jgi:hypothetical protein